MGSIRHVSRRKLRKWENDRMTQSNRILQQNALLARMARGDDINSGENSADDLDDEWENALSSLQIDIRTQFAPLLRLVMKSISSFSGIVTVVACLSPRRVAPRVDERGVMSGVPLKPPG